MPRLAAILAGLFVAATAAAQPLPSPVQWSAEAEPLAPGPGDIVTVTVRGVIEQGWRVYAMDSPAGRPLRVGIAAPDGLEALGAPQQMQPQAGYDQWFESDYTFFEGEAVVTQAFRLATGASRGASSIGGTVTFMACTDEVCLPPRTENVSARVRIAAVGGEQPGADPGLGTRDPVTEAIPSQAQETGSPDADTTAFGDTASGGWVGDEAREGFYVGTADAGAGGMWAFILLAIGAGLAALLSPCVFPMIPLTVSFFVHQSGDRGRAVRMATVYGLSIVAIFTGLGLAMALVVGAAGPMMIATNPWINLFIGAVLIFFGFSLLGYFELRLPSSWLNYFNRQGSERGGYAGVLFMGFTLTLVSFSCTVPFVGALLAQAVRAEWTYPIVGMVVFSSVFALPFVGFALFPRALQRLPKSGGWMTAFKGLLGFVVIAAAFQFLSNADLVWGLGLLPRPLVVALMIVIFALAGFFLLGRLHLRTPEAEIEPRERHEPVGPFRLVVAIACFGLALYMVPGLLGAPLGGIDTFLPPQRATDMNYMAMIGQQGSTGQDMSIWFEDREEAFSEARRRGQPVLVDFTGYTCTNCRYMEANVLSRPVVAERIRERFVPVKLWTDDARKGPELQRYQFELTGRIVLPTYAVVSSEGDLLGQISGITTVEDFVAFLDAHSASSTDPMAARRDG